MVELRIRCICRITSVQLTTNGLRRLLVVDLAVGGVACIELREFRFGPQGLSSEDAGNGIIGHGVGVLGQSHQLSDVAGCVALLSKALRKASVISDQTGADLLGPSLVDSEALSLVRLHVEDIQSGINIGRISLGLNLCLGVWLLAIHLELGCIPGGYALLVGAEVVVPGDILSCHVEQDVGLHGILDLRVGHAGESRLIQAGRDAVDSLGLCDLLVVGDLLRLRERLGLDWRSCGSFLCLCLRSNVFAHLLQATVHDGLLVLERKVLRHIRDHILCVLLQELLGLTIQASLGHRLPHFIGPSDVFDGDGFFYGTPASGVGPANPVLVDILLPRHRLNRSGIGVNGSWSIRVVALPIGKRLHSGAANLTSSTHQEARNQPCRERPGGISLLIDGSIDPTSSQAAHRHTTDRCSKSLGGSANDSCSLSDAREHGSQATALGPGILGQASELRYHSSLATYGNEPGSRGQGIARIQHGSQGASDVLPVERCPKITDRLANGTVLDRGAHLHVLLDGLLPGVVARKKALDSAKDATNTSHRIHGLLNRTTEIRRHPRELTILDVRSAGRRFQSAHHLLEEARLLASLELAHACGGVPLGLVLGSSCVLVIHPVHEPARTLLRGWQRTPSGEVCVVGEGGRLVQALALLLVSDALLVPVLGSLGREESLPAQRKHGRRGTCFSALHLHLQSKDCCCCFGPCRFIVFWHFTCS